jgi:hypothetical protein
VAETARDPPSLSGVALVQIFDEHVAGASADLRDAVERIGRLDRVARSAAIEVDMGWE